MRGADLATRVKILKNFDFLSLAEKDIEEVFKRAVLEASLKEVDIACMKTLPNHLQSELLGMAITKDLLKRVANDEEIGSLLECLGKHTLRTVAKKFMIEGNLEKLEKLPSSRNLKRVITYIHRP